MESTETRLPAWRAEITERVRAAKAKRVSDTVPPELGAEQPLKQPEPVRHDLAKVSRQIDTQPRTQVPGIHEAPRASSTHSLQTNRSGVNPSVPERTTSSEAGSRSSSAIVAAALSRARRASENASRASLPKIEAARPIPSSSAASIALNKVDKEATAKALEPAAELSVQTSSATARSSTTTIEAAAPRSERGGAAATKQVRIPAQISPEPDKLCESSAEELSRPPNVVIQVDEAPAVLPLDELEPMDYLEAEVQKVDRILGLEFSKNESPSIFAHLVTCTVDLLVISLSCLPFIALIVILNGSLTDRRTQIAAGAITLLISFYYLALTQCVCGKTFGMMFTNTRIVDARTFQNPSPQRALVRSFGYFIAAAPALLGFFWALSNRRRRGWHDYLSGTMLARDF